MERTLTLNLFNNLLTHLDPSGKDSGERYEDIRRRLLKFFEWHGCPIPDELTDCTIDRVAGLLANGREITSKDAFSFFHGVAYNVLREFWAKKRPVSIEEIPGWQFRSKEMRKMKDADAEDEERFRCLDRCAARLPSSDRTLIIQYYCGEKSEKVAKRRELAENLGISLNA
jgi:DNA-directed RNA polymerase specialized sigma24 family protein